ncbi:MAG: flavodoxin-dependent (E)-4-hydroxy-3-methylbut-2-enyl-diphosphate synthase [Christensenella sp.]
MSGMKTKQIKIGDVIIGGGHQITIQSMTNTDTKDVRKTVQQIHALEEAGCEIVRCAVPDAESAAALKKIKEQISIPLVADVHFDAQTAVAAIENGADKIRINPGNIGGREKIVLVVDAAKAAHIPIRVGVNAGSLSKEILAKHGGPTADALVQSALQNIRVLEHAGFNDIVVSIKSSNVPLCVEAYKKVSKQVNYPLHLGVTEAGTYNMAVIKSSIAIGALILADIGDTVRVSVTGDPVQEVYAARDILKSCGVRKSGVEIISCPTCGRCSVDIERIAKSVEKFTQNIKIPLKIAVMGCAVNGPGEAREADIGIAGGKGEGLLFAHGKIIKKVDEFDILPELRRMITELAEERKDEI